MKLMHELLKARVRPYYIYMADQVAGGEHFRTMVQTGLEIMKALRGWTSGLAIPHFVIDSPGGGGKVPLLPEYVESITDDEVVFRNYEGKRYTYKQPKLPAKGGCGAPNGDIVPIEIASSKKPAAGKAPRRKSRLTGSNARESGVGNRQRPRASHRAGPWSFIASRLAESVHYQPHNTQDQ